MPCWRVPQGPPTPPSPRFSDKQRVKLESKELALGGVREWKGKYFLHSLIVIYEKQIVLVLPCLTNYDLTVSSTVLIIPISFPLAAFARAEPNTVRYTGHRAH